MLRPFVICAQESDVVILKDASGALRMLGKGAFGQARSQQHPGNAA